MAPIEITKPDLIAYSARQQGSVWLDVGSDYLIDGRSLLLPDIEAVNNSIRNLLRCPIGSRGRTFQPTYGTYLYHHLQEPITDASSAKIRSSLIQSLEYWEPRIALDHANTYVIPDFSLPGYVIRVAYYYRLTNQHVITTFRVPA